MERQAIRAYVRLSKWFDQKRDELLIWQKKLREGLSSDPDNIEYRQALTDADAELKALEKNKQESSLYRIAARDGVTQDDIDCATRSLIDIRSAGGAGFSSVRSGGGGRCKAIVGYGAVFGKDSVDLGGFTEQIMPGAFTRALQDPKLDVLLRIDHDSDRSLDRTGGTLQLAENKTGLLFQGTLRLDDSDALNCYTRIQAGVIRGCSFAFTIEKERWQPAKADGEPDRSFILEVRTLFDVSPCIHPAYPATSVSVYDEKRCLDDSFLPRETDFEAQCRRRKNYLRAGRIVARCRKSASSN
jgi:hypothetical protein